MDFNITYHKNNKYSFHRFFEKKSFGIILFIIYFIIIMLCMMEYPLKNMLPVAKDGLLTLNSFNYAKNAILRGKLPLWNSLLNNGVSSIADVTNASFYPFKYLIVFFEEEWFYIIFYAIHLAMGGIFTYKYLEKIKCCRFSAVLTSLIYLFSIHLGGYRKEHITLIACAVYLPIIIYFIETYLQTEGKKYLVFSLVCMALQFFIGFPQYVVYTDLLAGIYLVVRFICNNVPLKKWIKVIFAWTIGYLGLISVQLLPFMELSKFYISSGAGETTYETFASYSIHPIRYLTTLFPQLFNGELWKDTFNFSSSGLDIELYLGTFVCVVLIYGFVNHIRDRRVLGASVIVFLSLIYASCGSIEWFGKIIYKIPLLGSFRAPSRVLFISIFFLYVIFAVALSEIIKKREWIPLLKIIKVLLVMSFLALAIYLLGISNVKKVYENIDININNIFEIFGQTIIILIIMSMWLKICGERLSKKRLVFLGTICLFVCINIIEVMPYWLSSERTEVKKITDTSQIEEKLQEDSGEYEVLVAAETLWGDISNIFGYNRNLSLDISTLNSYININNPRLSKLLTNETIISPAYNYSGLYTGFPQIEKNIICQNDILSMLGVKYIVDVDNLIEKDGHSYEIGNEHENIYFQLNDIEVSGIDNMLTVPITIEKECYYKISFDVKENMDSIIQGDLYEMNSYDLSEQDFTMEIFEDKTGYEVFIFSGENIENTEGFFRMWTSDGSKIVIKNLKIEKFNSERKEGTYTIYYENDEIKIYENTKAQPIIYIPECIVGITDEREIYNNSIARNMDSVSYVKNIGREYEIDKDKTSISNITNRLNVVTATISSESNVFVNFSQNYCPGWNAYIDGEKTDVYMVNGLIQGIEVPSGNHEISFVYMPSILQVAVCLSFCTAIIFCVIIYLEMKKQKHLQGKLKNSGY